MKLKNIKTFSLTSIFVFSKSIESIIILKTMPSAFIHIIKFIIKIRLIKSNRFFLSSKSYKILDAIAK